MDSTTLKTDTAAAPALISRHGQVLLITLNRPEALNAANASLSATVGAAIEELATDPNLRVGVLTGTGRAFCAGMDLKAFSAGEDVSAPGHPEWGFAGVAQHFIDKPLIAAVNGFALGGGLELLLSCDLVVASTQATFALPEVKRGLFAAGGGVFRLPRQIPRRVAMEMVLTGNPIDAQRGYELGLVNRVVAPDELLSAALELAESIAANAPLSVQGSKRLMHESFAEGSDWSAEIWARNAELAEVVLLSEDGKEGARAFAEKRAPIWQGR